MVLRYFDAGHRKLGTDRKVQTQSRTRMARIYTYPCASAFIRVHPRLISVSFSDRAEKIRGGL